ncbi:calcium uptake protein 3, mitochondrial isoform X3 [Hemicordylus capensis]|uniref:calcium uptake protein 3, mitochondrial isoform X3 n=1 Tax=Hemicordylus capensis TaxID=884348 RepID=UPI002304A581|nr:calcium uptake protein 3, mitochondrial isoform X3 [Hemicordylus capensis]
MAALRVVLRWRRCCLPGSSGPELGNNSRRLWRLRAGSSSSDGAPSGLGVAAAGAAGGAAAWFFCQRFFDWSRERELAERPPLIFGSSRGRGGGEPGQGRGLLPIPVAAAAKETTVTENRSNYEDLDLYATSREQRFRMFASLEFEGQLFMTPYDFIQAVTKDEPRQTKQRRSLTKQELNQILVETPPVWKGSSKLFRNLQEKGMEARELSQIEVTRDDVLNCLEKLKANKSPGPDGIHPRVLKELKCEIAHLLAKIFNLSLKSGSVPEDWRVANVTPIFKKGSRGDPGNYRPVSLTSVPGKLMESILKDKIVKHLEEQALLGVSQHGFRKGVISYTEYLFLLCILTKPHAGFRIAFNMFDTDGNEMVDKKEFLVLQDIFRKKNEKKERKGNEEKRAMLHLQLYGYHNSANAVLKTEGEDLLPRSYWDTLRRSTSQALFSDLAEMSRGASNEVLMLWWSNRNWENSAPNCPFQWKHRARTE